jgi:hypothetical protein
MQVEETDATGSCNFTTIKFMILVSNIHHVRERNHIKRALLGKHKRNLKLKLANDQRLAFTEVSSATTRRSINFVCFETFANDDNLQCLHTAIKTAISHKLSPMLINKGYNDVVVSVAMF